MKKGFQQNYDRNHLYLLSSESPYHEEFHSLLDEIREEFHNLKGEINKLKSENTRLKNKLEEIEDGQTDIFSAMTESERMAYRHQILGLISKIDNHLEEHS